MHRTVELLKRHHPGGIGVAGEGEASHELKESEAQRTLQVLDRRPRVTRLSRQTAARRWTVAVIGKKEPRKQLEPTPASVKMKRNDRVLPGVGPSQYESMSAHQEGG